MHHEAHDGIDRPLGSRLVSAGGEAIVEGLTTFGLIVLAELGDKSQLVCFALAGRYGPRPVVLGAALAFALLNGLAVVAGSLLGHWIPDPWAVKALAALVFAGFGVHTLITAAPDDLEEEGDDVTVPLGLTVPWLASATLLALAELGDKTQLSVAALSTVQDPLATWLGATAALVGSSAVAALAGAWLLPRLPTVWVQRAAGILFLVVAALIVVP